MASLFLFFALLSQLYCTALFWHRIGPVLIETWAMNLPTWKEDRAANAVCKHLFCRPEKDEECWPGGKCYIKRMMTSIRIVTPSQIRYFKKAVARSNIIPLAYPVLWVYVVKLIIIHIFCCYC